MEPVTIEESRSAFDVIRDDLKKEAIRPEGIKQSSIEAYMTALSLHNVGHIIIDPNRSTTIIQRAINHGFLNKEFLNGQIRGQYVAGVDLVVAKMDDADFQFDKELLEQTVVHELLHGSSRFPIYQKDEGVFTQPRTGFSVGTEKGGYGTFLEEGFCDFFAHEYLSAHRSSEYRKAICSALDLPLNTSEETLCSCIVDVSSNGIRFKLPARYLFLRKDGTLGFANPAIAAYGVEQLINLKPELRELMLQARTDVDALRCLARKIDEISNGLYSELTRVPNTIDQYEQLSSKDFVAKLSKIGEA